jgi:hypothetical protein
VTRDGDRSRSFFTTKAAGAGHFIDVGAAAKTTDRTSSSPNLFAVAEDEIVTAFLGLVDHARSRLGHAARSERMRLAALLDDAARHAEAAREASRRGKALASAAYRELKEAEVEFSHAFGELRDLDLDIDRVKGRLTASSASWERATTAALASIGELVEARHAMMLANREFHEANGAVGPRRD